MSEESNRPFCVIGGEIIGNVPTIMELAEYIGAYIKNDVYDSSWLNDTVNGATRQAIYNIMQQVVGQLEYKGMWDASGSVYPSNPELGWYYVISVGGVIDAIVFEVGDWIIWNGMSWDKLSREVTDEILYYIGEHAGLDNVHHAKTVSGDISLVDLFENYHDSLSGISANQHHDEKYLPIGTVLMYNGIGIANVSARTVEIGAEPGDTITMVGWFACNGNVSTPNLFNKFIRGESSSGNIGGSDNSVNVQHNHVAGSGNQSASHIHATGIQSANHSHTINSGGVHNHDIGKNPNAAVGSGCYVMVPTGGVMDSTAIKSAGAHGHPVGNQLASHSHSVGNQLASHSHGITVNNAGVSGVGANKPQFYSMIYIIRKT